MNYVCFSLCNLYKNKFLIFNIKVYIFFQADKLKHVNVDLTERLESAELQINAISNEYRGLLAHKEVSYKTLTRVIVACL